MPPAQALPEPAARALPGTSSVVRRALIVWGLGHLALGDRRGWLLVALQPLAIAFVLGAAVLLIDGTLWLVILPPLIGLIVIWIGQAIHAHQLALRRGAAPGGELQIAWFLPVAVAILTAFWLAGGRHGTPSATLQAYVEAWMGEQPEAARQHFVAPPSAPGMSVEWTAHGGRLRDRLDSALARYGPSSGIDPEQPFDSLRFREERVPDSDGEQVAMIGELVRSQRIQTTVLGVVPTAGQETVVVEPALVVRLALVRQAGPSWLPAVLDSYTWRISSVEEAAPAAEH